MSAELHGPHCLCHKDDEVITLIEEFRPDSIRGGKITHENSDYIFIDFFVQGYNMVWYKAKARPIPKNKIMAISGIDIGKE